MSKHYYLSVFPMEALIVSELEPTAFAAYQAIGSKKGAAEKDIFIELEAPFGEDFDWKYGEERCVSHADGRPKNSVYLGVYRVLERIPLSQLGSMYLVNRDGRALEISKTSYTDIPKRDFYVYQELCPIYPLVVSKLDPKAFVKSMTDPKHKVSVPQLVFTDLKVIDFDNMEQTGNIGALYDKNIVHLKDCINSVLTQPDKESKTIDRSHVESFSFQIIHNGIYIGNQEGLVMYSMPSIEEIKDKHYEWGLSAMII